MSLRNNIFTSTKPPVFDKLYFETSNGGIIDSDDVIEVARLVSGKIIRIDNLDMIRNTAFEFTHVCHEIPRPSYDNAMENGELLKAAKVYSQLYKVDIITAYVIVNDMYYHSLYLSDFTRRAIPVVILSNGEELKTTLNRIIFKNGLVAEITRFSDDAYPKPTVTYQVVAKDLISNIPQPNIPCNTFTCESYDELCTALAHIERW